MKCITLTLLLFVIQSTTFAQQNSLRLQSGLVHCSFDGTPMFNMKGENHSENQFLYASFGLGYQRKFANQIKMQTDLSVYGHSFQTVDRMQIFDDHTYPIYSFMAKSFSDLQFCFLKTIPVSKAVSFQYGLGPTLRWAYYDYSPPVSIPSCLGPDAINSLDIGANVRAEIAYTPVKWLTVFSQVNLVGFAYRFQSPFEADLQYLLLNSRPLQLNFPSRFDLSLRVGVGINF
ncbi:MAG: hypothetical protein RLZZ211_1087 [Bacteroidota bacterium]|jgi:hypothetical protein